jgi:hypothetical protein
MNLTPAKFLSPFLLALACISVGTPQAFAETSTPAAKKTVKKIHSKKVKEKKPVIADEDEQEPDVKGSTSIEYGCELGNKLTIFQNAGDEQHIALHWKKRLHRLTRVDTTTGANRFENRKFGLLWIGIPAKGMLLDSKKGQQLANECKNPEQLAADTANK